MSRDDRTNSAYAATAHVEQAIAAFLFERKRNGRGSTKLATVKRHLRRFHADCYDRSVLEARDLATNLKNRKLISMDCVGLDDNPTVEWVASELDAFSYLSGL